MSSKPPMSPRFEEGGFLVLVLMVTLAFVWLLLPYFGAILWGLVVAILFAPINRRLCAKLGGKRNTAAALTVLLILVLVIAPTIFLGISLVQEAAHIYQQLAEGDTNLADVQQRVESLLPAWAVRSLEEAGYGDLDTLRDLARSALASGLEGIASRALLFGQGALKFLAALGIMLYLIFFLLRDGEALGNKVKAAIPLDPETRDPLIRHFIVVVRATMKGSVVVAIVQGIIGGIIFSLLGIEGALLWGLLMGLFSLVPAIGTGIVWVPVALYLLFTGSVWEGAVLAFCGVFVIGLVDNILRPYLVGQDTRMPDFVVLISTLAGIELMGLNGFITGPMIAALFIAVWQSVTDRRASRNLE